MLTYTMRKTLYMLWLLKPIIGNLHSKLPHENVDTYQLVTNLLIIKFILCEMVYTTLLQASILTGSLTELFLWAILMYRQALC